MKFTLAWLRDHLETEAPLTKIADTLTAIGLEVERVENPAEHLAPFVTARVIEASPHPNADRLRVCRVDAGGAEISVVCGAPNARTGMAAVFAPPGAHVPGTGITLKTGEIRGVQSAGMLVSARELALGEDHDGIIELPEDTAPGQNYASWAGLDDPVIEIGVTPNRGDALGVRGIARDLAACGLGTLKPWDADTRPGTMPAGIEWQIEWPEACPWIAGIAVRGLRNGPSPAWLQRRLHQIGQRPRNILVDITNYFTFDIGRPLHVFDIGRLAGPRLTLRPGSGESFRALNGNDVTATNADLVIADANGAVSLAGIVGGEASGSTDATTDVFIECALFDPVRIALSGRRHQIHSDARARFERGIDPSNLPDCAAAAARRIVALCGGEPSAIATAGAEPAWRREARLRFRRLAELGGAEIAPGEAVSILHRLGFAEAARDAESVTVAVPPWRNDIASGAALDAHPGLDAGGRHEAAAATVTAECDLLEEVLRIAGLDAVPAVSLPRAAPVPMAALSAAQVRVAQARRGLAGRGFAECVGFAFTDRVHAALFGDTPESLRLLNPIAADLDQMRPSPLATLALAASRNTARGHADLALFEIGPGYGEAGERSIAAGLRTGHTPRHWQHPARAWEAMDAKADLLALLAAFGVPMEALSVTADAPAHYHPGRSGLVRQGPKLVLGRFGVLHPAVLAPLRLESAAAFELFMDALPEPRRRRRTPPDLPPFQPVRRDFAFVVPNGATAETILRAARSADRSIVRATLFDVYSPSGSERSLGIEIVLQPRERTLTDPEIEAVSARVIAAAAKQGARLR